jgi:hypothetical protein
MRDQDKHHHSVLLTMCKAAERKLNNQYNNKADRDRLKTFHETLCYYLSIGPPLRLHYTWQKIENEMFRLEAIDPNLTMLYIAIRRAPGGSIIPGYINVNQFSDRFLDPGNVKDLFESDYNH